MNKYTIGIILGLIGAGLSFQAQANQVLVQGPPDASYLTAQAPIIVEYNLAGPASIESETITAAGIIKTIFLSAESLGQVGLEVSANGGNSYTKIINGQPLSDGFIPGNQLRFKADIAQDSSLKKLAIGYTDSSGASRSYRNPALVNYKYHQEIYISGGSREVFNYPLHLNLGGDDIYFTAADGQTPLYYYLEDEIAASPAAPRNDVIASEAKQSQKEIAASPAAPRNDVIASEAKQSRTFWVKVPQIPKEGARIYMYYNNVIAASPEPALSEANVAPRNDTAASKYLDGSQVFPFFDDFNGAALNEEKWEIIPGLKKEYSVKDGYLRLKDCLVITRNFKTQQGILEFKAKAQDNAGIQVIVRAEVSAQGLPPYEQIVYSSNYPGAEHTIAINNIAKLNVSRPIQPLTYYMYKATINSTGILFERYNENQQEKQVEIKFLDAGNFGEGYIGLKADAAVFNTGSVYFDWIRARPYLEVEPVAEGVR